MTEGLMAVPAPDDPVVDRMAAAAGLPSELSGGRWASPEPIDFCWVFPRSFEVVWLAAAELEQLELSHQAVLWAAGFEYTEPLSLPLGPPSAPYDWRPYTGPPDGENLRAHPSNGPNASACSTRWSAPVPP